MPPKEPLYLQLANFLITHPQYIPLSYKKLLPFATYAGVPKFTTWTLRDARAMLPDELKYVKPTPPPQPKPQLPRFIIDMRHKTVRYEGLEGEVKQWGMCDMKHFTADMHGVDRLLKVLIAAGYSKTSVGKGRRGTYKDPVIVMRKVKNG